MDVRCERCGTEYEFDDALVSGRGTTVKCTNCGHKFKIRRSDGDYSEDFWNVRTGDGRTLVFTSLRELQRAIQARLVERTDMLSRGGLPPKPIGSIPELSPFFDPRELKGGTLPPAPPKLEGASGGRSRPPPPPGAVAPALAPPRQRLSTRPEFPAPPAVLAPAAMRTIPGTGDDLTAATSQPPVHLSSAPPAAGATEAYVHPPVAAPDDAGGRRDLSRTQPMSGGPPPPQHVRPQDTLPGVAPPSDEGGRASIPPPLPPAARGAGRTVPPAAPAGASRPPPVPSRSPQVTVAGQNAPVRVARPEPAPVDDYADEPDTEVMPSDRAPVVERPGLEREETPRPSERSVRAAPTSTRARGRRPRDEDEDEDLHDDERDHRRARARDVDTSSPLPPRRIVVDDGDDRRSAADIVVERRRPVGGYLVALVVVLGAGVLGAFWARDNLGKLGAKPTPTETVDPRVATFLAAGEQALAEGNLDLAKESFDKASVVAERDPRVLLDVARLAAARADVLWLKSRLLPSDAADEHRLARDGLAELAQTARRAADDALAVAPDDPAALRAKIDALRISGDRDGARALVAKLGASSTQPESAYVLAALDVAEAEPIWPPVVERLRGAAAAESGPGRARAALVYALARSGDAAGAKAEVERLAGMSRQHPLLPQLRAFAERTRAPSAAVDAGAPVVAAVASPASATATGASTGAPAPATHTGGPPSDPRVLVAQADAARNKGEYEKARTLYSAALDKNPNDSEALHGLGAIAHARRDLAGAKASYKRALSVNPMYLPALVGLADVEWESGDRATAAKTYKEIVDRFPPGTYPARIQQRLEAGAPPAPPPVPNDQGGGG